MLSRLNQRLRSSEGLTYGAYSFMSPGKGAGPWSLMVQVEPEGIGEAEKLLLAEWESFAEDGITEEELARGKAFLTGNFPVRLAVSNKEGLLRPGMAARVELRGIQHAGALLLPASALVDRKRRRVAYRVVDGMAEEVEPVVAATTGDRLPVLRGLRQGDRVIVSGLEWVTDGAEVQIAEEQPPPGQSGSGWLTE